MADVFTDAANLKRRQALLDAMTQQNLQGQIQGGGNYGLGQALSKVATAYVLKKKGQGVAADASANQEAYGSQLGGEVAKYLAAREGGPQELPGPPTEEGVGPGTINRPGNPRAAIVSAMTSRFPEMQMLGRTELATLGKQEAETFPNPVTERDPVTKALIQVQYGNRGTRRPVQGAVPFEKPMVVNDQLVDPGTAPGTDFRTRWKPPVPINGDLFQQEDRPGGPLKKLDNAPSISLSVGSPVIRGQKAGMEKWAELAGKTVTELADQARGSVKLLGTLSQLEQSGKSGVFSGPTASPAMFVTGLAKSLGVPINEAQLANSQTFDAAAISAWQDMIAAAGGNRGVVKEEASRIAQMVPQLVQTPQGRAQITAFLRQTAEQTIADAKKAQQEYAKALTAENPELFTFGLGATQLPRETGLPAAPGASSTAPGGVMTLDQYLKR